MITEVLNDPACSQESGAIQKAVKWIQQEEIVAFPTETVYGLGASALSPTAMAKIYQAKRRPSDNPLIIHVAHEDQVAQIFAQLRKEFKILAKHFWPGPLTIVDYAKEPFLSTVGRGLSTVAVRIPSHPTAQVFLEACKVPIVAPSANLSGSPSPTKAEHVLRDFDGVIPLILDGDQSTIGIESTVIDITTTPPTILRPGNITRESLESCLELSCQVASSETPHRSPGQKYKHYSPKKEVYVLSCNVDSANDLVDYNVSYGYIGWREEVQKHAKVFFPIKKNNVSALMFHLYDYFRSLDQAPIERIYVDGVAPSREGIALMDRLVRSASYILE